MLDWISLWASPYLMGEEMHVIPEVDLVSHNLCQGCHCNPRVKMEGSVPVVVHNAYDLREATWPMQPGIV